MTGPEREWTVAEIEAAIAAAIRAHDVTATVSLIRFLATEDPARAEDVIDAIQLGLAIASERN